MRVDLSEPECTNCYHCRASGIFPTQASELSNVIGSSPVSSGTVQALGDDSATVGSTSTSSPLQALGDDSATVGSTSTSSPLLVLRDDSAAVGSTSTSSPLQALRDDSAPAVPVQSSSPYLFGLPFPSITSISSGLEQSPSGNLFENCTFGRPSQRPAFQSPLHDTSGCCASATPLHSSSPFGSAPAVISVSSAPTQAFGPTASGFGTFAAPTPSSSESMQDPVKASGPSHNLCKPASSLMFGKLFGELGPFPRPDIGFSPASSSSTNTVVFGTTPVSVSSPFGPIQATTSTFLPFGSVPASSLCNSVFGYPPASSSSNLFRPNPSTNASVSSPFGFSPAVISVSSAPTQAFGPTTSGSGTFDAPTPSRFGSMQAPVQATFSSGASSNSIASSFLPFGCVPEPPPGGPSFFGPAKNMPWGTNSFSTGCGIEGVRSDVGVFPASSSVFGTTPVSVSSPFGPIQASTSTFLPFGSVPASSRCNSVFGSPPASSSSNLFRPNPSTNVSVSSPFGFPPAVTSVCSAPTQAFGPTAYGFGTFAASTPSKFWSMQAPVQAPFGPAYPAIGFPPEQGSRCPGYAPTPDVQTGKGDIYISISASNPYLYKSHEELRWEDYKQGFKGSRPKAVFSLSTASPSIFASPSVPDHSQKTNFATTQGNFSGPCFGCGFLPAAVSGATTFPSGGFSQPNAPSASHDWSRRTEQGSRFPGYEPTPDGQINKYISISASKPYLYKSHEELRWEDYKQGCCAPIPGPAFGFPSAAFSFSQPNALFTGGGTHFPSSLFSSSTTFPGVSSSVQRPHEAAAVSSPPFGFPPSVASASSAPTQNFGPKAVFSLSTASPSIFASPSVPDHSQKTNFAATQGNFSGPSFGCGFYPAPVSGTTTFPSGGFGQPNAPSAFSFSQPNAPFTGGGTHFPSSFSSSSTSFPGVSSSVQRPHEAAAVSSPPFRCTACGATSSSSASPNFTFNGATAPPSAAISLPWLFYPTSGFGTSSAAQVTSPAPVQGYILLPFAAMSLQ